jgi:tetratricopeptide (TPR) repeat protein
MRRSLAAAALLVALAGRPEAPALAQDDPDRLRAAKTLVFDRKYAEARQAWQAIRTGGGRDAEVAAYWVAHCSEKLGEHERAIREYGEYLARKPADRTLAEEAKTSRVSIAARLYEGGKDKRHLATLTQALDDPSRTVRYFAALQLSKLGEAGRPAIPVLKSIVAGETDEDLVERAKLGLLRLDPKALSEAESPRKRSGWLKIRIFDKGKSSPTVSVNLPMALAELAFKSLPDDARRELRLKGYDADNFWRELQKLGPTEIIEIVGEDGERIKIWIE